MNTIETLFPHRKVINIVFCVIVNCKNETYKVAEWALLGSRQQARRSESLAQTRTREGRNL